MDHADWVHEMTILYGERHAHNFRRAAAALDRLAALERELAEARKDGARLDWASRNKSKWGRRKNWKGEDMGKWWAYTANGIELFDDLRAAIDAAMGGE
jgi:hypothetical protein